jgi:hypothetical protein
VAAFVRSVARLVPAVIAADLTRAGAGVQAQAVLPDETLADDVLIEEGERSVHVLNAPSSAVAASLPIGEEITRRVLTRFRPAQTGTFDRGEPGQVLQQARCSISVRTLSTLTVRLRADYQRSACRLTSSSIRPLCTPGTLVTWITLLRFGRFVRT